MAYTVTENGSQFDRGVAAGEIAQRLKEHDKHFDKINGSMEKVAGNLAELALQMQRLADAAGADRQTVIVTAAALKDAEEARRDRTESRWSPLTRFGVFAGIVAAIATVAVWLANVIH